MEPTAIKKKSKKQRPRTIHDEQSSHDDMLRTHYPKRCPTYLVAFSLKETYDDLTTAQQMICKRSTPEHSPQESTNSITPTGSIKILETEHDNLNVNVENKYSTAERSPQESTNSITPTGSYILETDIGKSNIIATNKRLGSENSPHSPDSSKSNTPTGSFKILDIELDKPNIIAKSKQDHNPIRKNSPDSITPKNSLNRLETDSTNDTSQILDKKHSKNKPVSVENSVNSSIYSTNSSTPTSSLKFSSSDYSNASRITIGEKQKVTIDFTAFRTNTSEPSTTKCSDMTENAMNCDDIIQNSIRREVVPYEEVGDFRPNMENSPKYITVYVYDDVSNKSQRDNTGNVVNKVDSGYTGDIENKGSHEVKCVSDKINENTNLTQENRINSKEPESIFKAVRINHAPKKKFRRKSNHAVNIKQKKFKCKLSKKKIDARLERYYEKRNNSIDAHQVQLDLYSDEVSTVVSRTQVVHKKAKENLLENLDLNTFATDFEDERSLTSSFSTARKTLKSVSDSSQNTLVQEPSTISNVTDRRDMIKVNLDIKVDNVSPLMKLTNLNDVYKSELVSIPVTVAYDRSTVSKHENHLLTSQETSQEIFTLVKLPLTSFEGDIPFISSSVPKIYEPSSGYSENMSMEPSDKTLTNMNSSLVRLSSDNFYNARTSSQLSKCIDSYSTLTNDRKTIINIETTTKDSVLNKEAMIFKTMINLDRCDETPSTSSNTHSNDDLTYFNDIIVANVPNDKHSTYQNQSEDKDKKKEQENSRKTILTKTTDQPTERVLTKMLNLPNQMEIKAMIREREMPQIKCGDEMRNPSNIPPLWERLMSALEMAVHRLEDNLVDKIMKEIQKSIVKYPEQNPHSQLRKNAEQAATITDIDCESLSVQCDLVKSTTIDKILRKLSNEGFKIKEPNNLHKVDLYNDIEVVISPDSTRAMTEKGDQITISTLTSNSLKLHHHLGWLTSVPANFIRENMLVITSVPTFFVFMLCIYGLIQFLMKPLW